MNKDNVVVPELDIRVLLTDIHIIYLLIWEIRYFICVCKCT